MFPHHGKPRITTENPGKPRKITENPAGCFGSAFWVCRAWEDTKGLAVGGPHSALGRSGDHQASHKDCLPESPFAPQPRMLMVMMVTLVSNEGVMLMVWMMLMVVLLMVMVLMLHCLNIGRKGIVDVWLRGLHRRL